jgi:nucleotide-binding universal stress UspA family protein
MFKHLLVPLDGSHLAEAALPAAAMLGQILGADITLIHIIEQNAPSEVHGDRHLTSNDEACTYLADVAEQMLPPSLTVERHVHTTEVSNVARSIVDHVQETDSDLIIMCTHGRMGMHSWLFGSIAQHVIAACACPVLVIQPPESGEFPPFVCHKILVPLDGDPDHEASLPIVSELAQACSAEIRLVTAVHKTSTLTGEMASTARMLPSAAAAMLNLKQQGAEDYLRAHETRLKHEGRHASITTARGEPSAVIARTAKTFGADVIVLGTHGKAGLEAFWAGSITPKLARQTRTPILLICARGTTA